VFVSSKYSVLTRDHSSSSGEVRSAGSSRSPRHTGACNARIHPARRQSGSERLGFCVLGHEHADVAWFQIHGAVEPLPCAREIGAVDGSYSSEKSDVRCQEFPATQ